MTAFEPAAVSVYPGPDAGFVDPWGSVCGGCGTGVGAGACPQCGQRADAGDGLVVVDEGLVGVLVADDPSYPSSWAAVS